MMSEQMCKAPVYRCEKCERQFTEGVVSWDLNTKAYVHRCPYCMEKMELECKTNENIL